MYQNLIFKVALPLGILKIDIQFLPEVTLVDENNLKVRVLRVGLIGGASIKRNFRVYL